MLWLTTRGERLDGVALPDTVAMGQEDEAGNCFHHPNMDTCGLAFVATHVAHLRSPTFC